MREIKFRAWEKTLKEIIPVFNINFENKIINTDSSWRYLEEVELMQYTGLKDKNGVEIYEGDIVALDMWHGNQHGYIPEDGEIKWHQESSAFKWFSNDPSDANNYWLSQADEKQREVVGNVCENKELLK